MIFQIGVGVNWVWLIVVVRVVGAVLLVHLLHVFLGEVLPYFDNERLANNNQEDSVLCLAVFLVVDRV